MRVLPMKVPKLTYYITTCDLFPVAMISVMSATALMLEPLINTWRSATILFKTNLCSSLLPEKEKKGIEDWAKFHVIMYRIILEFQGIIKHGWTSPQWPPWGQKKVAITIDDWIFYQILSTNSLRKCMEISLENFYVDIGAERWRR